MELATISEVSKKFNVTTRTLRYYDQIGLLKSKKSDEYAYRMYDEYDVRRLQQIIILRKLRIKLKDIEAILNNKKATKTIEIFEEQLNEINDEIEALSIIKSIIEMFMVRLKENININIDLNLLKDDSIIDIIEALTPSKINFKEKRDMEELNKATNNLSKLNNVRIIYLPPATVASSQYVGANPEDTASEVLNNFIKETKLPEKNPDLRVYGFNNPCPRAENDTYGYEFWVTIPEDMNVPQPLTKKNFQGGLYAAHCIKMGDFHEWRLLDEWARSNDEYVYEAREPLGMDGLLEEHLNAFTAYGDNEEEVKFAQIDLLIPVKKR